MRHTILYLIVFAILSLGCSAEMDSPETVVDIKSTVNKQREKGEIPKDRIFYSILHEPDDYTLEDLIELYKKDITGTEGEDYKSNLQNMWQIVLHPRLIKEGTDEQKLYFINEQEAMDNNLPYFGGFLDLLRSCKSLTKEEKYIIAGAFYNKNTAVVERLQWSSEQDEKDKKSELVYTMRIHGILIEFEK